MAFVSVNDVYVMRAWEDAQKAKGEVLMLSDGNGDLAAAVRYGVPRLFALRMCDEARGGGGEVEINTAVGMYHSKVLPCTKLVYLQWASANIFR